MMDLKLSVDQFKSKHLQAGKQLGFSLLPLLFEELIQNGLNVSHADGQFYQDLAAELFENRELQLYAIDFMALIGQTIPNPKVADKPITNPVVVEVKKNTPTATIENDIVRTDHLMNNIPHEDDEGDPFYIPPEERLSLRPEDMRPMQYDEEFCKLIGVDTSKRQNR